MPKNVAIPFNIGTVSIMALIPYLDRVIAQFTALKFVTTRFEVVPNSDDDLYFDEPKAFVEAPSETRPRYSGPGFGCYAALTFAGLAAFLFVENVRLQRYGSLQTGYAGELDAALPYIQVEKVLFTGGVSFDDNGTFYRHKVGKQYVGRPTQEIEDNWNELVPFQFMAFTPDQKKSIKLHIDPATEDGLFRLSPEVIHSLHCINTIRRTIDGYRYDLPDQIQNETRFVLHLEHCIDFLRQFAMCKADLTPIPAVFNPGIKIPFPAFEQEHTCRNFSKIHKWATEQNEMAMETVKDTATGPPILP